MAGLYSQRPKKRKSSDSLETECELSSFPSPKKIRQSPISNLKNRTSNKNLTQSILDLGQSTIKTCLQCRMPYRPSSAEDVVRHNQYHAKTCGNPPIELTTEQVKRLKDVFNTIWTSGDKAVIRIKSTDNKSRRNTAHRLLQEANKDLGSIKVEKTELWQSQKDYQVLLYFNGRKCVGILLCQPVSIAHRVTNKDFPVQIDEMECQASMGISRIWTHMSQRRKGIGKLMLDLASTRLRQEGQIRKADVAFSQPTEKGARLARKWFEKEDGWLVYVE